MNKTAIIIIAAVIVFLLFFRKIGNGMAPKKVFKLNADFKDRIFEFTHPELGVHTVAKPKKTHIGKYNLLAANDKYDLGWVRALENTVVVTLMHKTGPVFSEVYVLDLANDNAKYYSEYEAVTISGGEGEAIVMN